MKQKQPLAINPWRAACNWHCGVLVFGALAASVLVAAPGMAVLWVIFDGQNPFHWQSGWYAMRGIQLLESVVIGVAGGALTLRHFRRRIAVTYAQMRRPLIVWGAVMAVLPVVLGMVVAWAKYGPTRPMLLTAAAIFGVFVVCFLAGSFHFARKLKGV